MRILCMCGKPIGYKIAKFLLEQEEHETRFIVNAYEYPGEWYSTPRELPITEVSESDISTFGPDLIVVAFYDKILRESLFSLPRFGTWNLHLSDAERYRGAYPNIWALRNGDDTYSVTLHRIDAGVDTGPILAKRSFPLPKDFTGRDLYERMTEEGFQLFSECFENLVTGQSLELARAQVSEFAESHYRKEIKHELQVTEEFKNQVRALTFPPFPPPYFMIGSRKFIIAEDTSHFS